MTYFVKHKNKGLRFYTGKEDIRMLEFYFFKVVRMFCVNEFAEFSYYNFDQILKLVHRNNCINGQ
jgi:hypothetical protein